MLSVMDVIIYCIMKLMRIDKFNDEDAAALKAHIRRLASIFQECNLFPFTF